MAVTVSKLTKTYKGNVVALDGVDLAIKPREIFCVVGPNGAGKTTLMRSIGTQLLPDGGELRVFGHDVFKEADAIRRRIAAIPQGGYPDTDLTPWEHVLDYLGGRGVPRRQARDAAEEALKYLNLWDVKDRVAANLSGGMARRVLLAMALAAQTELVIMDEPTVGLDPQVRRDTWELIVKLRERATILFTTHNMEEAEALADRVALVSKGRVLAVGTPEELRRTIAAREKVLVPRSVEASRLAAFGQVESYAGKWVVYPYDPARMQQLVMEMLSRGEAVQIQPTNLEDAYMACLQAQESGQVSVAG